MLKVEGNRRELFQEVELKFEYGKVVQEATGFNGTSDKNSQIVGLDFKNDLSPEPGSSLAVLEDSNPTSNTKDVKIDMNPASGSFSFEEDEWEFKEATSQIGPNGQVIAPLYFTSIHL